MRALLLMFVIAALVALACGGPNQRVGFPPRQLWDDGGQISQPTVIDDGGTDAGS